MIQLTLTLTMTTAQVIETSVTVNNNSPIQDYVHPDDQTQAIFGKYHLNDLKLRYIPGTPLPLKVLARIAVGRFFVVLAS